MLAGPFDQPGWTDYFDINFFCCLSLQNSGGVTYSDTTEHTRDSRELSNSDTSVSSDSNTDGEQFVRGVPRECVPGGGQYLWTTH